MITIFHNPRCRKSREAVELAKALNLEYQVIDYIKEPLSEDQLKEIKEKLDEDFISLIRKNEADYKKHFKSKAIENVDWIQAFIDYPKLMQRPIVMNASKAIVARPCEKLKELV